MIGLGVTAEAAECPVGFDAMQRLELLPVFLPNGTQTKQFITYDPAGDNRGDFFKRYEENGEYVFFDEIGPGFLCRQQMNVFSPMHHDVSQRRSPHSLLFRRRAEAAHRHDLRRVLRQGGQIHGSVYAAAGVFRRRKAPDGASPARLPSCTIPFPFKKRLKITAYHPEGMKYYEASYFQYTYLKYPPGTPVETWKGPEVDSPAVRTQFERLGDDPKKSFEGKTHKETLSLAPGETKTALDLSGQGAITSLRLRLDPWSADTFHHTRIRITWDDQKDSGRRYAHCLVLRRWGRYDRR